MHPRPLLIIAAFARLTCLLIGLAFAISPARGQGFVPYGMDQWTLHLWHLREPAAPAADTVGGRFTLPLTGFIDGAALTGASPLAGFAGSALINTSTSVSGIILPGASLTGTGLDVPFSLADPTTGAFTFEAVIQFHSSYNPLTDTSGRLMQILAMDDNGTGPRLFHFRYIGATAGGPPQIQFVNIRGTTQTISANVPTTGSNAVDNTSWFHVAVTYDPTASGTANMNFYWTKLTPAPATANLIGSGSMSTPLAVPVATGTFAPGYVGAFSIGNRVRNLSTHPTDGFVGYVAEVRISRIARSANAMTPAYYDSVGHGLPDAWQKKYFGSINVNPGADPDGDGGSNLQEYLAGSDPANPLSTTLDIDANGFPDAWELQYFGYIGVNPNADADGDAYTNAQEYTGGSDPTNPLSTPVATGTSGLSDGWQLQYYGHLGVDPNALSPNGDWFTNIQEYKAGTNPLSVLGPHPPGPKVRLIPVTDGTDPASSGYGYAGSTINCVSFVHSGIETYGNQQFLTFYGRHQTSATYAYNNTIWVARRTIGASTWQVFHTTFTANDITDGHDMISFGLDGEGYMHLSWGMHNGTGTGFHYTRSLTPVTGTNAIAFAPDAHNMTGNENVLTYPLFIRLPNGDLLYLYRLGNPATGGSGSGDTYLNRYSLLTHSWTNVNLNGATPQPFIQGMPWSPSYNAYPNMPYVDSLGNLFFTWTWRFSSSSYQSNQDLACAASADFGLTWTRTTGAPYTLPINRAGENGIPNSQAQTILPVPQNSSLINTTGMCVDANGLPIIATWYAPLTSSGNYRAQYMAVFPTASGTTTWTTRQLSNRTVDPTTSRLVNVNDMGRPVALCDFQGRIIVLYRDDHGSGGLTVCYSQTPAVDPQRLVWNTIDLTSDNLGGYEPVVDLARWQRDNILEILCQPSNYTDSNGLAYTAPANTASPVGVVEWDEPAYFSAPVLNVTLSGKDALLGWNSVPGMGYQLWTSTDLANWTSLGTFLGADRTRLTYTHPAGGTGPKRFWRLQMKEGSF